MSSFFSTSTSSSSSSSSLSILIIILVSFILQLPICIPQSNYAPPQSSPFSSFSSSSPSFTGIWSTYINSLPNNQLPHVPIVGNGAIGLLYDSSSTNRSKGNNGWGPGRINTVDIWIGSTSFWSCTDTCTTVASGCCRLIGLGGISISLLPTYPASLPLSVFNATQIISNGTLTSTFLTPDGTFTTLTYLHPSLNLVVTNITYVPLTLRTIFFNVSVWVVEESTDGNHPRPSTIGCADPSTGLKTICTTHSVPNNTHPDVLYVSRQATGNASTTTHPVWAGIAYRTFFSNENTVNQITVTNTSILNNDNSTQYPWEITNTFMINPYQTDGTPLTVSIVTAEMEVIQDENAFDPGLGAAALLISSSEANPVIIQQRGNVWWNNFWSQSSVSFPSRSSTIETVWYGAQYVLACTSSTDSSVPAPALYGVFATSSGCSWNGDFTLDYNAEATYFGIFSSNHVDQFAPYPTTIYNWIKPAQTLAQQQAQTADITCPNTTLHYACHLAPWGYQSYDETIYMHWNGNFAALPLINLWEYTYGYNVTYLQEYLYPFISGINDWWSCYLNKTYLNPDSYLYQDNRVLNPDAEHEGQLVSNPQIALTLIARTVWAQLHMAKYLNITVPSVLTDIAKNLVPFNTALWNYTNPNGQNFTVWNNTRCHNDNGFISGNTLEECMQTCASLTTCDIFSYCPNRNVTGCDVGPSCWQFTTTNTSTCTNFTGFISGEKIGPSPIPESFLIWTGYGNATRSESDTFALYPLWPSELLPSIGGYTVNSTTWPGKNYLCNIYDNGTALTGAVSCSQYIDWNNGRTVDVFTEAVLAGYGYLYDTSVTGKLAYRMRTSEGSTLSSSSSSRSHSTVHQLRPAPPFAFTPTDVLNGIETQMQQYFGPNLLLYAPGGGIENIGITRAINDMLVQSMGGIEQPIQLFPFWPFDEPASFRNLLVKGGILVSATYDNSTQTVVSPFTITVAYTFNNNPSNYVQIISPWYGANSPDTVQVTCGGSTVPVDWFNTTVYGWNNVFGFYGPINQSCEISLNGGYL